MNDYNNKTYKQTPAETLNEWNISFKDNGNELLLKCPFSGCDDDSRPNEYHLYLNASKGIYKCHKCNETGNMVTMAKHLGKDVNELFENTVEKGRVKKTNPKSAEKKTTQVDKRTKRWHESLDESAWKYLKEQCGLAETTIKNKYLGLAKVDGKTWFSFPIFDQDRKVIFYKLRRVPWEENTIKYRYYPKGATAALYGIEQLESEQEKVFVTEGEKDALTLQDWGYIAVSSTGGAGTFPKEWVEAFCNVSKVYFCFDNDDTGKESALKHAKLFSEHDVYILGIPELEGVKDVTELKVVAGYEQDDFERLITEAIEFDPNSFEFSDLELVEPLEEFTPSQYFRLDKAYITLPLNIKEKEEVVNKLYVVSSAKEVIELDRFGDNKYRISRYPKYSLRWSNQGIESFLMNDQIEYDYYGLFDRIVSTLQTYLDFPNSDWYMVIALWIWGTYFHRMFNAYPYFNVNGFMSSGKTKMLEVVSHLAFNGKLLMGSTPAYVIREIHDNSATILLDEVEMLKNASTPEAQTLSLMLNAGYKKGPFIGKMDSKKEGVWSSKEYDPYSPKMIAGINNLSDTLQSRSISLTMLASNDPEIKNREVNDKNSVFQEIRDGLYLSVMELHNETRTIYQSLQDQLIQGRNWEVWKPILVMAKVIDKQYGDGDIEMIYPIIREFALERISTASSVAVDNQSTIQLLITLLQLFEDTEEIELFFSVPDIKNFLIKENKDEFEWLEEGNANRYIGPTLTKAGVVSGGSEVKKVDGKSVRGYVLNLEIIKERLKALGFESKKLL